MFDLLMPPGSLPLDPLTVTKIESAPESVHRFITTLPDSDPLKLAEDSPEVPLPPPDFAPDPPLAPATELPEHAARPTTRTVATRRVGRMRGEIAMNRLCIKPRHWPIGVC